MTARPAVSLAAALALAAGSALAAEPIPLAAGTYCGPGDAKVIVDADRDQVTIDGMVCSFPVIAADHLQSDLCSTAQGTSGRHNFEFRVVGPNFVHDGAVYQRCGTAPKADG